MIRTRFAPSPTGSLHVGNARIAVLNWLFTRRHDGRFILRIEDTDATRTVAGSERQICDDLLWLGLPWDEGPECAGIRSAGTSGPYRQSERASLYREWARRLQERGFVYPCYCTAQELEARRAAAIAAGRPARYDGRCRTLPEAERARHEAADRRPALRVRVDDDVIAVEDAARGTVRFPTDEIGDFIIVRSDGEATYNFAVVVDDITMAVTHVIRGAGHLSNTPRQVVLHRAFGGPPPRFVHVPTVLGPDRQKLSKRHGAQALAEYRAEGYHPDGLLNYLSLLAWSSPSGEEVLSRDELVAQISLERIGVADVVFDPVKLRWLSGKHIERMPLDELVAAVTPYIGQAALPLQLSPPLLTVAVQAVRSHLQTFADIVPQLETFFPDDDETVPAVDGADYAIAAAARRVLSSAEWTEAELTAALKQVSGETGARGRALYEPLRRAVSRRAHGPPFIALLLVQGRERVLAALDAVINSAGATREST